MSGNKFYPDDPLLKEPPPRPVKDIATQRRLPEAFDPVSWKADYPNPAFSLLDGEDAFWAAKQIAAFSEADIRALVETGEYSDRKAEDWIVS